MYLPSPQCTVARAGSLLWDIKKICLSGSCVMPCDVLVNNWPHILKLPSEIIHPAVVVTLTINSWRVQFSNLSYIMKPGVCNSQRSLSYYGWFLNSDFCLISLLDYFPPGSERMSNYVYWLWRKSLCILNRSF